MIASDLVLLPFALWAAVILRLGIWPPHFNGLVSMMLMAPLVAIPVLMRLGLYRAITRYAEDHVLITVVKGVTLSVLILIAADALFGIDGLPRSAFLIYWGISVI